MEFLLLKRAENIYLGGLWQMVTGRIEDSEKGFETAIREIKEETGLTPKNMWVAPNINSFYNHLSDTINMIPVFAIEVEPELIVTLSPEHSEFQWCSLHKTNKLLAWDGQKKSAKIIHDYFINKFNYLNLSKIL
ncbi:MAG: NUDIX pyrophosphatase [Melioribacteraceae bacterium]|nr:NUDIX pyrophosphatase [Melioribacteraceae bacterium]